MQIFAYNLSFVYDMQKNAYNIFNMSETDIIYLHLYTVIPAFIIGTYLMINRKGSTKHKYLGKIYMILMFSTALISLFIPAAVGPRLINHFGYIHLLSLLVMYGIPTAYMQIKKGRVVAHRSVMIQIYIGGLLIAGGFAVFSPGRLLNNWLMALIS